MSSQSGPSITNASLRSTSNTREKGKERAHGPRGRARANMPMRSVWTRKSSGRALLDRLTALQRRRCGLPCGQKAT